MNEPAETSAAQLFADFPVPSLGQWREAVERELKGADFDRRLVTRMPEGFDLQPLHTRADLPAAGGHPLRHGTPWLAALEVRAPSTDVCAQQLGALLEGGQLAVSLALDSALRGCTAQQPTLVGDGCAVLCVQCLRAALAGVDVTATPLILDAGLAGPAFLPLLCALLGTQSIDRSTISGTVGIDPVEALLTRGSLPGGMDRHLDLMADSVAFARRRCPELRPVLVHGGRWQEAGATATTQLAAQLATGVFYMRELIARGVAPAHAAAGIALEIGVSQDLFPELAKVRAARLLWAKATAAFGVEGGAPAWILARTSAAMQTRYDVHNNLVRNTIAAMAAVIGGCDALVIEPFDAVLGDDTAQSRRLARNQHHLLREESFLDKVADAAAGSYCVEWLTDKLAREAWAEFQRIESAGGIVAALKAGTLQAQVEDAASRRAEELAARRRSIVGVSRYARADEDLPQRRGVVLDAAQSASESRISQLTNIRDKQIVEDYLRQLAQRAKDGQTGLLDIAVEAAREGATVHELMSSLMSGAEGALTAAPLRPVRHAAGFERLRDAALRGERPVILLLPFGDAASRRARAEFCQGFFAAGGFHIVEAPPIATADDAAREAGRHDPTVAVLCGADAEYAAFAADAVPEIRDTVPEALIYVAGNPPDAASLMDLGVDGFVHLKSSVIEELARILAHVGTEVTA